jgi:hypothetical protein
MHVILQPYILQDAENLVRYLRGVGLLALSRRTDAEKEGRRTLTSNGLEPYVQRDIAGVPQPSTIHIPFARCVSWALWILGHPPYADNYNRVLPRRDPKGAS